MTELEKAMKEMKQGVKTRLMFGGIDFQVVDKEARGMLGLDP